MNDPVTTPDPPTGGREMQRPARLAAATSGRHRLTGGRRTYLLAAVLAAVLVGVTGSAADASPATTEHPVDYVPSDEPIANPERGFYHDPSRCDHDPYDLGTLRYYRAVDDVTLVLCDFYLTNADGSPNLTGDLRPEQLDFLESQARTLRTAGTKMILRFAYTEDQAEPPYDAAPDVVLRQVDQLTPVLRRNADVIAVMQAGFVGKWGEGWYTDHYGDQGNVTEADWTNRKAIIDRLLTALPERMVQVRTITQKGQMYGYEPVKALGLGVAARVGHHNDCFLRNDHDSGTYGNPDPDSPGNPSAQDDRDFLRQDSRYVAVGGETCGVAAGTPDDPTDRTDCAAALPEMAAYHYSFLNQDYSPAVLAKWREQGCKAEIDRRLGYRFTLRSACFPDAVDAGGTLPVHITVGNTGFAAPFNPRPVFLVLRNTGTGEVTRIRLGTDAREWSTTAQIDEDVMLPSTVYAGTYELLLDLPDEALSGPDYAIRMATEGVWEPTTGYNKLLTTLTVR
jgi:hypothetical protein